MTLFCINNKSPSTAAAVVTHIKPLKLAILLKKIATFYSPKIWLFVKKYPFSSLSSKLIQLLFNLDYLLNSSRSPFLSPLKIMLLSLPCHISGISLNSLYSWNPVTSSILTYRKLCCIWCLLTSLLLFQHFSNSSDQAVLYFTQRQTKHFVGVR